MATSAGASIAGKCRPYAYSLQCAPCGAGTSRRTVSSAPDVKEAHWTYRGQVVVHASAAHVKRHMPMPVRVTAVAEDRCRFEPGSDNPAMLALYLGVLDADFEVVDAPELVEALRQVAGKYQRAVDASGG